MIQMYWSFQNQIRLLHSGKAMVGITWLVSSHLMPFRLVAMAEHAAKCKYVCVVWARTRSRTTCVMIVRRIVSWSEEIRKLPDLKLSI